MLGPNGKIFEIRDIKLYKEVLCVGSNVIFYLRNVPFQFGTFKVKKYKLIQLIMKKKKC